MNIEKPDYLDYLEEAVAAAGMTEINSFAKLKGSSARTVWHFSHPWDVTYLTML